MTMLHNQIHTYLHELEALAGEVESFVSASSDPNPVTLALHHKSRFATLLARIAEARAEIAQAAKIAAPAATSDPIAPVETPKPKPSKQHLLNIQVADLPLTNRAIHALQNANIFTVERLVKRNANALLKVPNLGLMSVYDVRHALSMLGLALFGDPDPSTPVLEGTHLPEAVFGSVQDLELSVRSSAWLDRRGFKLVGQVAQQTVYSLRKFGLPIRLVREIDEVLKLQGLQLGMRIPGWNVALMAHGRTPS